MENLGKPKILKESTKNTATVMMLMMAADALRDLHGLCTKTFIAESMGRPIGNNDAQRLAICDLLEILLQQLRPMRDQPLIETMTNLMRVTDEDGTIMDLLENLINEPSPNSEAHEHVSQMEGNEKMGYPKEFIGEVLMRMDEIWLRVRELKNEAVTLYIKKREEDVVEEAAGMTEEERDSIRTEEEREKKEQLGARNKQERRS
ncbi:uncharacterized protein [Hoplias malabaricus]|uniref:uncharacterized protein n=1 Tax=Hoplias malabaricus TaxID=27720 RepID=UPI003462B667